jgi:KaiC/GvpD/RAD55 family RecA-like ATPase
MKQQYKTVNVPYSESGKILLMCIFDALKYVVENDEYIYNKTTEHSENYEDVYSQILGTVETHFNCFYSKTTDFHLSGNNKRLAKILLKAYKNVREYSKFNKGVCIPSPLNILYQILTVPGEYQSVAYAVVFCRSLLYEAFKVFPEHYLIPSNCTSFDFSEISSYLDTFLNYTKEYRNIAETNNNIRSMLAHYLALKGIFYLRFNDKDEVYKYLELKKISTLNDRVKIEFHKYTSYSDLPDVSTLVNELTGIPIPVKGIDTIFQGGLKTNSKSNLVMRISGQAGSGKTSFALALAAAMSPFGTFTYYISLEEAVEDLTNRLHSLIPEYLKKISIYNKDTKSWFDADTVSSFNDDTVDKDRLDRFGERYLDEIYNTLHEHQKQQELQDDNLLPAVCPLIIVIDSIRPFRELNFDKFITKCRQLKSLVILISPNDEQYHNDIDYMVDVVINLKHFGTETQEEKPTRILQLLKTRYQVARHGAHVFHLSSKNGIHISPQLPSQIDKKEIISKPVPSNTYYINFFNEYNSKPPTDPNSPFLPIWGESQILLHGYGSTGKAGLALTLLLYPFKEKMREQPSLVDSDSFLKRKILVISLLYSDEYYRNLYTEIKKRYSKIKNTQVDCLCFYSGYLSSEDFVNKIIEKLDAAILEGEPFTGILLDGLHNATLQFPKLQKSVMVWSTLYSLLAKYNLTIVTTFTNFIIDAEKNKENEILLKGGELLLDIIFQAADYSFSIRKSNTSDNKKNFREVHRKIKKGQYVVTLKSAIKHKISLEDENFIWDREDFLLEEYCAVEPDKQLIFNF